MYIVELTTQGKNLSVVKEVQSTQTKGKASGL